MPETRTGDETLAAAREAAQRYLEDGTLQGPWYELGGSSIDAARFVTVLGRELGLTAGLKDLLTTESVADYLAQVASPEAPVAGSSSTTAGGAAGLGGADFLWPALAQLPARERIRVAHRILEDLLQRAAPLR